MEQTNWALNPCSWPPLRALEDPPPPVTGPSAPAPYLGAVWKREKARLLPGLRGKVTWPSTACLSRGPLARCELRTRQSSEVIVSKTTTGRRTHSARCSVTGTSGQRATQTGRGELRGTGVLDAAAPGRSTPLGLARRALNCLVPTLSLGLWFQGHAR